MLKTSFKCISPHNKNEKPQINYLFCFVELPQYHMVVLVSLFVVAMEDVHVLNISLISELQVIAVHIIQHVSTSDSDEGHIFD
jgi:hypothetical protein